jgi:hypothetical protein
VDFVDIADLKAEAPRREPQERIQRVGAAAWRDVQAHGKAAPGRLLTALRSVM